MFSGIGWIYYIKTIALVVLAYYLIVGWIFRKDLLQWFLKRRKREV